MDIQPDKVRDYENPPVHEVILDVLNTEEVEIGAIEALAASLRPEFPTADQVNSVEMVVNLGPGAGGVQPVVPQLQGVRLRSASGENALQLLKSRFSFHNIRSELWPKGHYRGWPQIQREFQARLPALVGVYGSQQIRRAGLRYLNRIAVPRGRPLDEWLRIGLQAPAGLSGIVGLNLRQTWEQVESNPDVGATIGLVRINIEDPELSKEYDGLLLDIEVFNYWVSKSPTFGELANWFERAHAIENQLFESCVTDALRQTFGGTHVTVK